jgi:predicted ATP-binding protein involved in virulence
MQDAIVLIDEIENGFHLDWQYTIVRNLVEWGKNNQYILATHSYELCTAVTPAHVKEIEPKLTTK